MFIVFQTIPILVENPQPVGFGGDPINAAKVQLPFALVFLVFGPASGIRTCLRSNNIQVRIYETNHSWHSSEHYWVLWSCDIPFN